MTITVLDGYTLNPGDLSWEPLQQLGECRFFDRTSPDEVIMRAAHSEIILTNKTVLSGATLKQLPALKYVGVLATGYNIGDIEVAKELGITVTNVPGYATISVAQMAFGHLLNLALGLGRHAESVRDGKWAVSEDFSYRETPLSELSGMTMGIVGYGQIGRATARLANAFGMYVLVSDRKEVEISPDEAVRRVDLDDLFIQSDVVSLHCPLTPETKGLVSHTRLSLMKPTAFLINTSRGPLIDENALALALNESRIAGAGLDVLSIEPPPVNHPLISARNCHITPHIAWATKAARTRLLAVVVSNLKAFLAGSPENWV